MPEHATSGDAVAPGYSIIIPQETITRAADYLHRLKAHHIRPGAYLRDRLTASDVEALTALDLIGRLMDTKRPRIFAELAVSGDGSDWSLTELGLLGDISIAVPSTAPPCQT